MYVLNTFQTILMAPHLRATELEGAERKGMEKNCLWLMRPKSHHLAELLADELLSDVVFKREGVRFCFGIQAPTGVTLRSDLHYLLATRL